MMSAEWEDEEEEDWRDGPVRVEGSASATATSAGGGLEAFMPILRRLRGGFVCAACEGRLGRLIALRESVCAVVCVGSESFRFVPCWGSACSRFWSIFQLLDSVNPGIINVAWSEGSTVTFDFQSCEGTFVAEMSAFAGRPRFTCPVGGTYVLFTV